MSTVSYAIPANRNQIQALVNVTNSHVNTEAAAFYLNRKKQTLRLWACYETGPVRPIRINRRLAWPVDQIRTLLANGS